MLRYHRDGFWIPLVDPLCGVSADAQILSYIFFINECVMHARQTVEVRRLHSQVGRVDTQFEY
jgi:hypothetical protein